MFTAKNYQKVESLEEAWTLNQKRNNRIAGGILWLRMSRASYQTIIDLSGLGLDKIEETEDSYRIGCMTTLRQLECNESLNAYTNGAVKDALHHIIGVQFRNLATIGGSIYGRYGFSDVLTVFLSMDSYVELYKGGLVPLSEYVNKPYDRDILVAVIINKEKASFAYRSVRTNASTDFPVLTCSGARLEDGTYRIAVGARPGRARILGSSLSLTDEGVKNYPEIAAKEVKTQSNLRGSASYRKHLTKVLTRRVLEQLVQDQGGKE